MHILIVTNSFSRIQLFNFAQILSQNHKITAISFDKGNDSRSKGKEQCYNDCILVPGPKHSHIKTLIKAIITNTPYCVLSNSSSDMKETIDRYLDNYNVDVVIFDQLAMGQYHTFINGCKTIFYPVDAQSRQKKQRYKIEYNPFKKLLYYIDYQITQKYERQIYNQFDNLFLATDEDVDYTKKIYPDLRPAIHVVSSGVDLEYFHLDNRDNNFFQQSIVFFGNLKTVVNQQAILWFYNNIWHNLKQQVPQLKWYIVGTAPTGAIQNLANQPDIIVTGYVEDYREYIWNCNAFIASLVIGTGLKNKVVQAMAMGAPVVATPLAMEGIEAQDKKHFLLADDAKSFKDAILLLINNQEFSRKMGIAARKQIEKIYSWQAIAENFAKTIEAIVNNERNRLPQATACAGCI